MQTVVISQINDPTVEGYLGQIQAICPNWRYYWDTDKVTAAHEMTHGINARVRGESKYAYAFMIRAGLAVLLPSVRGLTLRDIAKAVPVAGRGPLYQLYLVDQAAHWNDSPLYVLDEVSAYFAGARVGLEVGAEARTKESAAKGLEMLRYAKIAARLAAERKYPAQASLEQLIQYYDGGLHVLTK